MIKKNINKKQQHKKKSNNQLINEQIKEIDNVLNPYSNKTFTVPNIVSFIRIIIIIFASKELITNNYLNSFILYLTAVLTDFIDGFLARKLNQISELGKMLDPLADKLLVGSALIILLIQARIPLWYVIIVVGRDLFNMLGGLWISRKIKFVLPSILIGKIAAVITMICVLLNIISFKYIQYFYYTSTVLLIISTFFYILEAKKQLLKLK